MAGIAGAGFGWGVKLFVIGLTALTTGQASGEAFDDRLVRDFEIDGGCDGEVSFGQHLFEGVGLGEGAGIAVEDEPGCIGGSL
jgi:hypothetical protein